MLATCCLYESNNAFTHKNQIHMHVSASLAWMSKWTLWPWIKTLTRIRTQMLSVEFTTLESITHIQLFWKRNSPFCSSQDKFPATCVHKKAGLFDRTKLGRTTIRTIPNRTFCLSLQGDDLGTCVTTATVGETDAWKGSF